MKLSLGLASFAVFVTLVFAVPAPEAAGDLQARRPYCDYLGDGAEWCDNFCGGSGDCCEYLNAFMVKTIGRLI